jgi:hypothetical protein
MRSLGRTGLSEGFDQEENLGDPTKLGAVTSMVPQKNFRVAAGADRDQAYADIPSGNQGFGETQAHA